MSHTSPKIVAYLKTYCGWSEGVRKTLRKYNLRYENKDIIKNPAFRTEMEQLSGQPLSPCVEIDGHMLAGVGGDDVEKWLIQNEYVQKNEVATEPLDPTPESEELPKPADLEPARRAVKKTKISFFD